MPVLGIETATSVCGAAVAAGGSVIGFAEIDEQYAHAERLIGLIGEAMEKAGVRLRDLDGIGVSIGPGSFTGLRIGLSAGKGLAFSLGKPLFAVPTLDALARRAGPAGDGVMVLPLIDARRGEVYCRPFLMTGGIPVPEGDVRDVAVEDLGRLVNGGDVLVTGNAAERMKDLPGVRLAPAGVRRCSATMVAIMGEELLHSAEGADPRTLEPRYIKEFFIKAR